MSLTLGVTGSALSSGYSVWVGLGPTRQKKRHLTSAGNGGPGLYRDACSLRMVECSLHR